MTERPGRRSKPGLQLIPDFAAWIEDEGPQPQEFFRHGLIVLDANVLLDLYRITPTARSQVLETLLGLRDRLWVPHQAALEFTRNRKRVVLERTSSFRITKQALRSAAANAVDLLEAAVEQLLNQRERNRTSRSWQPADAGLDRQSLQSRLEGVMDSALDELDALMAEHDLHPADMHSADPLLHEIGQLLAGRIGEPYAPSVLRALVEEAHAFRFPNKIPPGFLDVGKVTQLRQAGDYVLWRQTIDEAMQMTDAPRHVLMITNDLKSDWWDLDEKRRPRGPRAELVQELRDTAQADLLLLSLKDFLAGANSYLLSAVSETTLSELREVSDDAEELIPDALRTSAQVELLSLSIRDFERLIRYMLIRMGYEVNDSVDTADAGVDLVLIDQSDGKVRTVIAEVKRYRGPIGRGAIRQLQGTLLATSADSALLITTGSFSSTALEAARNTPILLIDGLQLAELLGQFGFNVTISASDE